MRKLEGTLVVVGVLFMALATGLLIVFAYISDCVQLLSGGCLEVGFAYEGAGKIFLLLSFSLFLSAALVALFRFNSGHRA